MNFFRTTDTTDTTDTTIWKPGFNIHIFDYPDPRLSRLFCVVLTGPDNRGSTVNSNNVRFFVKDMG